MSQEPENGRIVVDEIGLAVGRLGGWILRTSFLPVFQRVEDALQPAAVVPGLLLSRERGSEIVPPICAAQRRIVAGLAAELHRINLAHVGAPGLCVVDGFDLGRPDELCRFGRLLPPPDPFALPEECPGQGLLDIVRLDIRLVGGPFGAEARNLLSAHRAEGLDILLSGIADARLLERALELGSLFAGPRLGVAQPAGTEIDTTRRPLSDLLETPSTLVAFRPRDKKTISAPDRRVQNL